MFSNFEYKFAVAELRKLSDSGIYRTLSLSRIQAASTQDGVFHHNTFLELELSSPHFKGGASVATFDVMVMRHLEDGTYSFAIDEFPEMDEDAIEMFWIEKVERHREEREKAFKQMELEALEQVSRSDDLGNNGIDLNGLTSDELLKILSSETNVARRQAALKIVDARWQAGSKQASDAKVLKTQANADEL